MWAVCFPDVRGLGSSPEAGKTGVTWGLLHFPSGSWAAGLRGRAQLGRLHVPLPGSLAFVSREPQDGVCLLGSSLSGTRSWEDGSWQLSAESLW